MHVKKMFKQEIFEYVLILTGYHSSLSHNSA